MPEHLECHICGGSTEGKPVTHELEIRGELLHFRAVPAKVCTRCGEKRFSAAVAKRIEQIIEHRDDISLGNVTFLHVPSFDYSKIEDLVLP